MEQRSLYSFFFFGTIFRFLSDVRPGMRIHDSAEHSGWIEANLKGLFTNLDLLDLKVTRRAAYEVENISNELSASSPEARLTEVQAKRLSVAIRALSNTLTAEISGSSAYVVTPKRLDVEKLQGDVPSLLPPNVFQSLPEIAKYDLAEAGKCLAFERSTAAAFHLLRGTESVLRQFYKKLAKRNVKATMWHDIVLDLRKRRSARKLKTALDHLDNIRNNFRNPTQHPEKVYDIDEAQNLWGVCIDAIHRMATA